MKDVCLLRDVKAAMERQARKRSERRGLKCSSLREAPGEDQQGKCEDGCDYIAVGGRKDGSIWLNDDTQDNNERFYCKLQLISYKAEDISA
ncbi:hypothetical protein RJ639_018844 [Escallonia herrerae]|uniref:Uncharacterized protein n=1 Tax=Escallonia herrerae TaxID=1293975 RepID=A0AA89AKI1_9ASTE|nr:hypothetical protein RJ639_018844 [Escallonia herrerae]